MAATRAAATASGRNGSSCDGRRLAVSRINRQYRQEDRLVFDVTLEDKPRLILYYYPHRDAWLAVPESLPRQGTTKGYWRKEARLTARRRG